MAEAAVADRPTETEQPAYSTNADTLLHAMLCGDALTRVQAVATAERLGLAGICIADEACTRRDDGRPHLFTLRDFQVHLARTDPSLRAQRSGQPLHTPENVRLGAWDEREEGSAW